MAKAFQRLISPMARYQRVTWMLDFIYPPNLFQTKILIKNGSMDQPTCARFLMKK